MRGCFSCVSSNKTAAVIRARPFTLSYEKKKVVEDGGHDAFRYVCSRHRLSIRHGHET